MVRTATSAMAREEAAERQNASQIGPHSNATFVWTQQGTLSSVCAGTCSAGPAFINGWRRDPANSSVLCVKQASAERKSSPSTAEGAPAKRTPGTLCVFCLCVIICECVTLRNCIWLTGVLSSRLKTPPRPPGQRTEPESRGPFQGFGDNGFHMSFGIGAFPFGFFTTVFNTNDPYHRADAYAADHQGNGNNWQDSLFLFVAIFFFFWLLSV
uniref:Uncharacterized protein n=1 Tax=Oncorhynchus tshawytscha TaxID=74940 RepID=A0AAZ3QAQ0_ONCTS